MKLFDITYQSLFKVCARRIAADCGTGLDHVVTFVGAQMRSRGMKPHQALRLYRARWSQ